MNENYYKREEYSKSNKKSFLPFGLDQEFIDIHLRKLILATLICIGILFTVIKILESKQMRKYENMFRQKTQA